MMVNPNFWLIVLQNPKSDTKDSEYVPNSQLFASNMNPLPRVHFADLDGAFDDPTPLWSCRQLGGVLPPVQEHHPCRVYHSVGSTRTFTSCYSKYPYLITYFDDDTKGSG